MSTLTCGRCDVTSDQVRVAGILSDPPGWSTLTLTGHPILNTRLCPDCTEAIRADVDEIRRRLADLAISDAETPAEVPA